MIRYPAPLVTMLDLIDGLPCPTPSTPRSPGRPSLYSDRLLLKALVIMIVRRLSKVHALLRVFEQPTQEMQKLKQRLYEQERFPSRWTFDRRHCSDPDTLPEQMAWLGQHLLSKLNRNHRFNAGACLGWGLAQEGSSKRDRAPHLD